MSKIKFTIYEIEQFRNNPWIKNISENSITYTEEFREHFILEYNKGKSPSVIFREAGFNIEILGKDRISSATKRFKKMSKRVNGLKDTRTSNSGRPLEHELTDEEKLKKLESENLRLRQQLQFLKKMEFLVKQVRYKKSKQEKDIKQSKKH